jgi:hypothetical protein
MDILTAMILNLRFALKESRQVEEGSHLIPQPQLAHLSNWQDDQGPMQLTVKCLERYQEEGVLEGP